MPEPAKLQINPGSPLRLGPQPPIEPVVASPTSVVERLELVLREADELRNELNALRRRDETLNYYMHRLDEELRLAARLQQDFLPKTLPQLGSVHFHTLFRPAGYVSGDLYDVMRLDEQHIGFYIADAVGHGMPAALLTMFIKHAMVTKEISGNAYRLLAPGETLSRLNSSLIDQNLSQAAFATALYGVINVQTLDVTLARAGHPNPLLIQTDGAIEPVACEGPLLGIFPDEKFEDIHFQLHPGERLILYTDGVEVAFTDDGAMECQQWREELRRRIDLPCEQLLHELAAQIDSESGSLEPKDDLTVVIIDIAA
jgi:sigma-B regulation protein RsbU (phosphoserine phosphatase)